MWTPRGLHSTFNIRYLTFRLSLFTLHSSLFNSMRDQLLRRFPHLSKLPQEGVYVVGGAVRDLVLSLDPADADLACVDALACARRLGRKIITLGKDHLSAYRVVDGEHVYDFAPLLEGSIDRDLARRDFTVNAMAVELAGGALLDPFDGRGDLDRRVVRMVGATNFDDDPLRLLKAVRMAVRLEFDIDKATLAAIRERAASVTSVAAERLGTELEMIFGAGAFRRALALPPDTAPAAPLFCAPPPPPPPPPGDLTPPAPRAPLPPAPP